MVAERDASKIDPNTGNTAQQGSTESQVDIATRVQDGLGKASDHGATRRDDTRDAARSE